MLDRSKQNKTHRFSDAIEIKNKPETKGRGFRSKLFSLLQRLRRIADGKEREKERNSLSVRSTPPTPSENAHWREREQRIEREREKKRFFPQWRRKDTAFGFCIKKTIKTPRVTKQQSGTESMYRRNQNSQQLSVGPYLIDDPNS